MDKEQIIKDLLEKYRSGTCTEKELKELLRWMEEDSALHSLLDEMVDRDWHEQSGLTGQQDKRHKVTKKPIYGNLGYRMAAATVLFLLAAAWFFWFNSDSGTILYATGYGERQLIELPDGSQVELNANSTLTWNENWKRKGIRSVKLDGEAYFDVVRQDGISFEVLANEAIVKVLGTSFNVSTRRGETEVFLNEGKVELEIPNVEKLVMGPGEKVAYREVSNKITKSDQETLHSAAAWKIGVISFQKVALKDIIPELNDIYGKQLVCRDTALNVKIMDVGVPYMDWEITKGALELAMNVEIVENDGVYLIEMKE